MLSYQHGYHAGNFADVIKHVVLVQLLEYLIQKDKPLFYLETHAGRGCYALKQGQAQRTREFEEGIALLWNQRTTLPSSFTSYLKIIQSLNASESLAYYPGSPYFALQSLRAQDRLYLCEAHRQEHAALAELPTQDKRVHVACEDGWGALKALLPPPEKRGLIFIDPSFEIKAEYQTIPKQLYAAYQKFPQGMYCLWYPMLPALAFKHLTHALKGLPFDKTLQCEFFLTRHPTEPGLYGSGLWVINPPYTLAHTLKPMLDVLKKVFNPGQSGFTLEKVLS